MLGSISTVAVARTARCVSSTMRLRAHKVRGLGRVARALVSLCHHYSLFQLEEAKFVADIYDAEEVL